jgi:hypothetical protein
MRPVLQILSRGPQNAPALHLRGADVKKSFSNR